MIKNLTIDDTALFRSTSFRKESERIIADILKGNHFTIPNKPDTCHLHLSFVENKLGMAITWPPSPEAPMVLYVPISRLRQLSRDYAIVYDTYFDAIHTADVRKIETIDMGRRALHNEGAEMLQDLLNGKISIDLETARNLFSLIFLWYKK